LARTEIDKAIALASNIAVYWNRRGVSRFNANDYEGAYADEIRATQLNQFHAGFWRNRGMCAAVLNHFDDADRAFAHAVQLNVSYAEAYGGWGGLALQREDYATAITRLEKAILLKPNDPAFVAACQAQIKIARAPPSAEAAIEERIAEAHCEAGDYSAAVAALSPLLRAQPQHPQVLQWMTLMANAYYRLGEHSQVIALAGQVLLKDPKSASAHNLRALSLEATNRNEEALADYSEAIAREPNSYAFWFNRGMLYQGLEDPKSAIRDFSAVIALNSEYVDAYALRARSLAAVGEFDKALNDLEKGKDSGSVF
jgi:tetratricopeptide (TPR) repeat protein